MEARPHAARVRRCRSYAAWAAYRAGTLAELAAVTADDRSWLRVYFGRLRGPGAREVWPGPRALEVRIDPQVLPRLEPPPPRRLPAVPGLFGEYLASKGIDESRAYLFKAVLLGVTT